MAKEKNPEDWEILINQLNVIRKEKKMIHQDVADKAKLQRSTVTRFFSGKYNPKLTTLSVIGKAVGAELQWKKINPEW